MPKSKLPRKGSPTIAMPPPASVIHDFAERADRMLRRADKLLTDAHALVTGQTVRKSAKDSR